MPSAANVKIEKQLNTDAALAEFANGNLSPIRQAITVIEHKIRNLEKRKVKLESYRDLQSSGKELNNDQKVAVAKYDEVIQTLEFARDLSKQFLTIAVVSEKDAKKVARKECAAKSQSELAKIREVLLVQDALNQMGQDAVREDFLLGRNGAIALSETDLKLLDDIYPAVTPKHESGNPTAFTNQVQGAAEHLLAVVDGKPKEAFGGTYSQIKEVIGKIHESGYFDQATSANEEEPIEVIDGNNCENEVAEVLPLQDEPLRPYEMMNMEPIVPMAPLQVEPPTEPPMPTEVYFQPTHPRPITEMLGGGSFFFLQDSELDTPDSLPSQTFTNTSFVQAPPPPIPLPPNFQQFPQPANLNVMPQDNGVDDTQLQQSQVGRQEGDVKHRGQQAPRNANNSNNQQPYYNNNNSTNHYNNNNSNRQRQTNNRNSQNRSGSRH